MGEIIAFRVSAHYCLCSFALLAHNEYDKNYQYIRMIVGLYYFQCSDNITKNHQSVLGGMWPHDVGMEISK